MVARTAKENLAMAFVNMGDVAGLVRWGKKNPTEFYRIWARLVPREQDINLSGGGIEELLASLDTEGGDKVASATMDSAAQQLGLLGPMAGEA